MQAIVPFAGNGRTRVLLAVIAMSAKGPVYLDPLAAEVGMHRSTVDAHLRGLRADGLVAWETGRKGTLRPLVVPR